VQTPIKMRGKAVLSIDMEKGYVQENVSSREAERSVTPYAKR